MPLSITNRNVTNFAREDENLDTINTSKEFLKIFNSEPIYAFPDIEVQYPDKICNALLTIYDKFNEVFSNLIGRNQEWSTDYRYCLDHNSIPINWIVQIDMVGLTSSTISYLKEQSMNDVVSHLRSKIYEIENNWAAYHVHEQALGDKNQSLYSIKTKAMLSGIRERFGKPIAILAETEEKYREILESEFGKKSGETILDTDVYEFTGFDKVFGPQEFLEYIQNNESKCEYLLYVRASDPISKLRNPENKIDHILLNKSKYRRLIKAQTLTINIDNPEWKIGDYRRVNDTKQYMPHMGMAKSICDEKELESVSNLYGNCKLRIKPAQGSYGCYGHETGYFSNKKFRYNVRRGLKQWNKFIVQPEYDSSSVINIDDHKEYYYMDRVFCGMTKGSPEFFGGHRLYMPRNSMEAKKGRLHIRANTVIAEINSASK